MRRVAAVLVVGAALIGCSKAPVHEPHPAAKSGVLYPAQPAVAAPPFKLFHHTANTFTLVTAPNASDGQIEALLYQLRDAAQHHSFDKLGIPQRLVDARDPIDWFYVYRGTQCATEKYASGKPPCGASYHAAGAFTYGDFKNHERTEALLLHNTNTQGDGAETPLWNADTASQH